MFVFNFHRIFTQQIFKEKEKEEEDEEEET